jgi:PKD repeat protein
MSRPTTRRPLASPTARYLPLPAPTSTSRAPRGSAPTKPVTALHGPPRVFSQASAITSYTASASGTSPTPFPPCIAAFLRPSPKLLIRPPRGARRGTTLDASSRRLVLAALAVFAALVSAGCTGPGSSNQAPVAAFFLAKDVVQLAENITFNGNGSADAEGNPLIYQWNFGDGSTGAGPIVSYAYLIAGKFTVSLTVTDSQGASNTHAADLTVNAPPQAVLEVSDGPYFAKQPVLFTATASHDTDGAISSFGWDFGDGSTAAEVTVAHAFAATGSYTVRLVVVDDHGAFARASSTLFADLHTYDVGFASRQRTPDTQRNITLANATKTVTLEIFEPNITRITINLNWSDFLPFNGPPNDVIRLTVTSPDGPSQTQTSNGSRITLEFNLNAVPSPVQVRAATAGDVPGVLGDAYIGSKGIGVWVVEITAVDLMGGLASQGSGIVPELFFFWTLTTTVTAYEANPVQSD